MSRRANRLLPIAVAAALLAPAAPGAAPLEYLLTFASLPSAQGWTYTALGSHASAVEPDIFSVGGGVLVQNSMGQPVGAGGGIMYVRNGGITTTETKQILVSMRCLEVEGATGHGGVWFGFSNSGGQYGFSVTPTEISVLQSSFTVIAGTFDNTQFHDYVFDWSPGGTWQLYRDAVLITSGSGGFPFGADQVTFGDGTGGANARAEIREYRFTQDLTTAASGTTWGRLKSLYR
jgi:hypothetical protein